MYRTNLHEEIAVRYMIIRILVSPIRRGHFYFLAKDRCPCPITPRESGVQLVFLNHLVGEGVGVRTLRETFTPIQTKFYEHSFPIPHLTLKLIPNFRSFTVLRNISTIQLCQKLMPYFYPKWQKSYLTSDQLPT